MDYIPLIFVVFFDFDKIKKHCQWLKRYSRKTRRKKIRSEIGKTIEKPKATFHLEMSMKRSIHPVFSLCVIKIDRGTDGVGRKSFVSLKNVFCVFKTIKTRR